MIALTIRIPDELRKSIEKVSKEKGLTKNAYINIALADRIKKDEKKLLDKGD